MPCATRTHYEYPDKTTASPLHFRMITFLYYQCHSAMLRRDSPENSTPELDEGACRKECEHIILEDSTAWSLKQLSSDGDRQTIAVSRQYQSFQILINGLR